MVVWGIVADRFHCRKSVWLVTKSASTCILLLLALPFVFRSFIRILVVSVTAQLFVSSGILDAYTLELLGSENKMYYGRYRLYASLSWGVGSIIMGWVTDHYGFDFNFIMFGVLSAMMIVLVATKIPETSSTSSVEVVDGEEGNDDENADNPTDTSETPDHDSSNNSPRPSGNVMDLVRLALRPRVTVFLLEVLIMGAGMATVERLLFLYMVNDLHASTLLCGLSVGVNVLFELPIFWYASPIMKTLGHDGMFLLSMICFVVRVYGYTWLTPSTKGFILLLESMHGVTFATFWIVTTDVSKVLVEKEGAYWNNAIPMCVQMLYSAVGVSVGSVLGGWAMHRYGSREMYTFTAAMVLCMTLVHITGSIFARTCSTAGSFLPDFPHLQEATSNNSHGSDAVDVISNRAYESLSEEEDDEPLHLTSTDIIQRGCVIEREDMELPRHCSRSTTSKLKNPASMLMIWFSAQSVSTASGLTTMPNTFSTSPSYEKSFSTCRPMITLSLAKETIADEPETTVVKKKAKPVKKRKSAKSKGNSEPYHWSVPSDKVLIETQHCECDSDQRVTRLGFKVRGSPRPLQRHRTSRGFMYNPSAKYQKSFQNVVEELLFWRSGINGTHSNTRSSASLQPPIFPEDRHLIMSIIFRMKRPKNHFVNSKPGPDRLKKTAPSQVSVIRTDVDNLTKFVLDSMNEVLYEDDRQIMSIHVTKLLDNDGDCEGSTEVLLRSMDDSDVESILSGSFAMIAKDTD
ncbi:MAG: hypothetical protein SGILL_005248 [Bacillariaceae sp.]